jgi:hypothetical protein
VRVRDYGKTDKAEDFNASKPSPWSYPATVETALQEDGEFRALFIAATQRNDPQESLQPIRFRKTFKLPKETA